MLGDWTKPIETLAGGRLFAVIAAAVLALAILLIAGCAGAERAALVAKYDANVFTLYSEACDNAAVQPWVDKVNAKLAERGLRQAPQWRAGHVLHEGADYEVCWVLAPNGRVFILYPDGDAGLLPFQDFQRHAA